MKQVVTLPRHGCARCEWWKKTGACPWGICRIHGVPRWYQAPPCEEYELDASVTDEIELDQ